MEFSSQQPNRKAPKLQEIGNALNKNSGKREKILLKINAAPSSNFSINKK